MNLDISLRFEIQKAVTALFNQSVEQLQIQPTNKEFEGSHTLVCFPIAKISKKGPEETAKLVGEYLLAHSGIVSKYNVVKGFLNLVISDKVWVDVFRSIYSQKDFGVLPSANLSGFALIIPLIMSIKESASRFSFPDFCIFAGM